ncbi:unnamed protein product [Durusdinium trenchii]|uniref:Uncharacterized protein n=1 Tax=Durusdinium trenchii TaxID=1381693 RepID=A0ABP0H825_9DINO
MAVFQLPLPPATALHEPAEEQEVGSIHDYKDGTRAWVTGSSDLKESQHYPVLFGRAMAEVVNKNKEFLVERITARRTAPVWMNAPMFAIAKTKKSKVEKTQEKKSVVPPPPLRVRGKTPDPSYRTKSPAKRLKKAEKHATQKVESILKSVATPQKLKRKLSFQERPTVTEIVPENPGPSKARAKKKSGAMSEDDFSSTDDDSSSSSGEDEDQKAWYAYRHLSEKERRELIYPMSDIQRWMRSGSIWCYLAALEAEANEAEDGEKEEKNDEEEGGDEEDEDEDEQKDGSDEEANDEEQQDEDGDEDDEEESEENSDEASTSAEADDEEEDDQESSDEDEEDSMELKKENEKKEEKDTQKESGKKKGGVKEDHSSGSEKEKKKEKSEGKNKTAAKEAPKDKKKGGEKEAGSSEAKKKGGEKGADSSEAKKKRADSSALSKKKGDEKEADLSDAKKRKGKGDEKKEESSEAKKGKREKEDVKKEAKEEPKEKKNKGDKDGREAQAKKAEKEGGKREEHAKKNKKRGDEKDAKKKREGEKVEKTRTSSKDKKSKGSGEKEESRGDAKRRRKEREKKKAERFDPSAGAEETKGDGESEEEKKCLELVEAEMEVDAKGEGMDVVNSSTHRAEWMRYTRWLKNKKRFCEAAGVEPEPADLGVGEAAAIGAGKGRENLSYGQTCEYIRAQLGDSTYVAPPRTVFNSGSTASSSAAPPRTDRSRSAVEAKATKANAKGSTQIKAGATFVEVPKPSLPIRLPPPPKGPAPSPPTADDHQGGHPSIVPLEPPPSIPYGDTEPLDAPGPNEYSYRGRSNPEQIPVLRPVKAVPPVPLDADQLDMSALQQQDANLEALNNKVVHAKAHASSALGGASLRGELGQALSHVRSENTAEEEEDVVVEEEEEEGQGAALPEAPESEQDQPTTSAKAAALGDVDQILLRHEQSLLEQTRSEIKWGFRGEKWMLDRHGEKKGRKLMNRKKELGLTCADPELPDDKDELLYFTLVCLDVANINEVSRLTRMELEGCIDQAGLEEFTKAGGVLDPNAGLKIADFAGSIGANKLLETMSSLQGADPKNKKNRKKQEKQKTRW